MKKSIPDSWWDELRLPAICAPMFLVSGPELVKTCCLNGVIGAFPAPNARPIEVLDAWMGAIKDELAQGKQTEANRKIAPWAMNMIVHSSYGRLQDELALIAKHQPPLVITSLGSPKRAVEVVHEYGGLVFSDVSDMKFARKAAEAGVDGLILVAHGAGGHAGQINNFAFIDMVRSFWDGIIVLAGAISTGRGILAAQAAGADLAYMGTRFIVSTESMVTDEYRRMLVECTQEDIISTDAFTGVKANMLIPSIRKASLDPNSLVKKEKVDFDGMQKENDAKAWRDIWSAGHGVGAVHQIESAAQIIGGLEAEYQEALETLNQRANPFSNIRMK